MGIKHARESTATHTFYFWQTLMELGFWMREGEEINEHSDFNK